MVRYTGVMLLALLIAGLLILVTKQSGVPPQKPTSVPVEIRSVGNQPVTETVDRGPEERERASGNPGP
jgi:hypothetical protein